MKKYEVMFIVRPNLETELIKKEIESVSAIFTSTDSKVLETKEWGLRELAYEIARFRKGYYVWMLVEATPEAIKKFDTLANYSENLIRHIVVVDGE